MMHRVSRSSGQRDDLRTASDLKECFFPEVHRGQHITGWYGVCEKCYCLQDFMAGEICSMVRGHSGDHNETDREFRAQANADALYDLIVVTNREHPEFPECPDCGSTMHLDPDDSSLLECDANPNSDDGHYWDISELVWEIE